MARFQIFSLTASILAITAVAPAHARQPQSATTTEVAPAPRSSATRIGFTLGQEASVALVRVLGSAPKELRATLPGYERARPVLRASCKVSVMRPASHQFLRTDANNHIACSYTQSDTESAQVKEALLNLGDAPLHALSAFSSKKDFAIVGPQCNALFAAMARAFSGFRELHEEGNAIMDVWALDSQVLNTATFQILSEPMATIQDPPYVAIVAGANVKPKLSKGNGEVAEVPSYVCYIRGDLVEETNAKRRRVD